MTAGPEVQYLPGLENAFSNLPEPKTQHITAHTRKIPSRNGQNAVTLPPDIPVERHVIDLPENEKVCPETGLPLVKIGEEVTQKLALRPGSYYVKETVRVKYALPQGSSGGIRIPPLPESLLDRCMADESFLAHILTLKFADHLPLYRISEGLTREKILIPRQVLCNWVMRSGYALKPLVDEMERQIFKSEAVFIDETPLKMLEGGEGKTKQVYMWVLAGGRGPSPPYRLYAFRTDRCHHTAEDILKGYEGILHSDKYGAYEKIAKLGKVVWCPCWAHIRRKFFEAESGDPAFRDLVLSKIGELFSYEKAAWGESCEERLRIRKDREEPIIDELIHLVQGKLIGGEALPKLKFRGALEYFCGLIPYMKNYLSHPFAHLDNNSAERAVRPVAMGRKNWLFVGNERGGEVAAIILSLVQTCRALGVNPREYLEDVMRRLMSHPAQRVYELLPDQWMQTRQPR